MTLSEILEMGSRFYIYPVATLTGPVRTEPLVTVRFSVIAACRSRSFSTPAIARAFGGRDHGAILHALKQINAERFGELWVRHQTFMMLTGGSAVQPMDALRPLLDATNARLEEIEAALRVMQGQRDALLRSRAELMSFGGEK